MRVIVDRFEGNIAAVELEDGSVIDCPKAILPPNAKEGSIINITVDENVTNAKLKEVTERMNKLFKD